jgi:hypothetical protein
MSELLLLARKVLTGLLTDQMDLLKDLQADNKTEVQADR